MMEVGHRSWCPAGTSAWSLPRPTSRFYLSASSPPHPGSFCGLITIGHNFEDFFEEPGLADGAVMAERHRAAGRDEEGMGLRAGPLRVKGGYEGVHAGFVIKIVVGFAAFFFQCRQEAGRQCGAVFFEKTPCLGLVFK